MGLFGLSLAIMPYLDPQGPPRGWPSFPVYVKSRALHMAAFAAMVLPLYRARTPRAFALSLTLFGLFQAATGWQHYAFLSRIAPHPDNIKLALWRAGIVTMDIVLQVYLWRVRHRLQYQEPNAAAASSTVG